MYKNVFIHKHASHLQVFLFYEARAVGSWTPAVFNTTSLTSNASFNVTVGYWQQRGVKMGYFTGEIIPVCCWNTVTEQQPASLLAPQDTGYVKPCLIFLISLHLDHKGLLNECRHLTYCSLNSCYVLLCEYLIIFWFLQAVFQPWIKPENSIFEGPG